MKKTILISVLAFVLNFTLYSQVDVTATSGTVSASYSTLEGAFDKINDGTHQGEITIDISGNTSETSAAILNASGSGSASYTSVGLQPSGGAARTISGSQTSYLIYLNGADNVTIDGLNTGSNSLTIENTNTGSTAKTISFNGGATSNIVTNCSLKGSCTGYGGVVYFDNSGTNNSNQITYCDIGPSGSNNPAICVRANNASASNTIDHCNIFDFHTTSNTYTQGIAISNGTAWTITNNSFYQTASRDLNGMSMHGIYINDGDGYNISGNYFGGTQAECGGSDMTYNGNNKAVQLIHYTTSVDDANSSTIDGNTFQNISFTSSSTYQNHNHTVTRFSIMHLREGRFDITNNLIGSTSETGNITLTQTGNVYTIIAMINADNVTNYYAYFGDVNNNTISGVTVTNSAASSEMDFNFFYLYYIDAIDDFSNNLIGSTTTSNSITLNGRFRTIIGNWINKYSGTYASDDWSNNTVQNIAFNNTNNSYGIVCIMADDAWLNNIVNNTVKDISCSSTSAAITAIVDYSAGNVTFSGNNIENLSGAEEVYGIKSTSTNPTIHNNFIRNLSTSSSSAKVYGIYTDDWTDGGDIYNNVIELGDDISANRAFRGIYVDNGADVYYNTVYIGGTGTSGTQASYAFYNYSSGTRNIKDNIFSNERTNSGGSGSHYAIRLYGSTSALSCDYNDYYAPNTGGVLGQWYYTNKTTLVDWQSSTNDDANSLNSDPQFASAGGNNASDYIPSNSLPGTTIAGITTDYIGNTRAGTPTMGAFEGGSIAWDGSSGTDWNTAANWNTGSVPGSSDNIFIPDVTNDPILDQNRTVANLFIGSGGVLDIPYNRDLTVSGDLTNQGTLTVSSGASGTASLLVSGSVTGSINFERYISGYSGSSDWHFLSSPVQTFSIAGSDFEPGANDDFYSWSESDNLWLNYKAGNPTQIETGKGYLWAVQATGTKTFTGIPNNSDVTFSNLSSTPSSSYQGFHLLGNPFPCAVQWDISGGDWSLTNVNATAKVWSSSGGSYTDIAEDGYIPATQGFMIYVSSGTNSITIPKADRAHSSTPWYKNEIMDRIKLTAFDPDGSMFQETVIQFNSNATNNFDMMYDSYFMSGYAPYFYSSTSYGALSTNGLPGINESLSIPLSFTKNASDNFYIEAEGVNNLSSSYHVYLTDLRDNFTQNLSLNPSYAFTSSDGDDSNRFLLHFGVVGINENEAMNGFNAFVTHNTLNIINPNNVKGEMIILNMTGQSIMGFNLNGSSYQSKNINLSSGIYIIKVNGDKGVYSNKVFVK